MNKRNYDLRTDGYYIRLELKNGAGVDYLTPNKDLFDVLDTWHISPFLNGGRLQCDFWQESPRNKSRCYLYDIAYACYHGSAHAVTFQEDMQRFLDWKNLQGLTIDHLDGNVHNNTVLNLSPMPFSINASKQSFPAGFVPPYTLNMAYVGEEYRVQMMLQNTERDFLQRLLDGAVPGAFKLNGGDGLCALHFLCEDSDSLISCLKYLCDVRFSWCNPDETARAYKRQHKYIDHRAADIRKSLAAQKALAHMDRTQFQIFNPGECQNN